MAAPQDPGVTAVTHRYPAGRWDEGRRIWAGRSPGMPPPRRTGPAAVC